MDSRAGAVLYNLNLRGTMRHTNAQRTARDVLYQFEGDLAQSREALRTRAANARPGWPMSPAVFGEALSILEAERADMLRWHKIARK